MTYFNENIKTIRVANRYTQQVMADKLGVKRQLYQAWEENRSRAKHEELIKISEAFGVTIDDLIKTQLEVIPQNI